MQRRKVRGEAEARACLAAVELSGMERAAWARTNGVSGRSLNAWRLILDRKARRGEVHRPLQLIELVPNPAPDGREPTRYVVRRGEWSVEVDERFDAEVLRRLLDVVAAC